jgi:hypothetical protein
VRTPDVITVLYKNLERLVKGVTNRDRSLFLRVLRYTNAVRVHVPIKALVSVTERYVTDVDVRAQIVGAFESAAAVSAVAHHALLVPALCRHP